MRYKKEAPETLDEVSKGLRMDMHCRHYNITHDSSVNTLVKAQGKIIGYFSGDVFIKSVIGSKHQLLRPRAWAVDAEAFDKEIKPNATEIVVIDKETGIEYHCPVETFDRLKGELDRGFGRQYFLTLTPGHWEVRGDGHQLGLWGGGADA